MIPTQPDSHLCRQRAIGIVLTLRGSDGWKSADGVDAVRRNRAGHADLRQEGWTARAADRRIGAADDSLHDSKSPNPLDRLLHSYGAAVGAEARVNELALLTRLLSPA